MPKRACAKAPPARGRGGSRSGGALADAAVLAVAVLAAASCGGSGARPAARAPAAEPAFAPSAPTAAPGRTLAVGSSPEGIAVDPSSGLVVLAVRSPAALVVLDPRLGRVVRRIPIAAPARHLQQAGPGGPVLVPEEAAGRLLELRLPSATFSLTVGAHPHDATAAAGSVFVADEFGRSVSRVRSGRVVETIPGFIQPGGIAAVGGEVAVVDVGADTVTLLDARSGRVVGRMNAGAGPTHVVGTPDGRFFVVDTRGGAILSFLAGSPARALGRLALDGSPYGIAIDRSRRRLWVTLTASNRLVELALDAPSPRVLRLFATARQPNSVAVDERSGLVFVASAGEGSVQILRPRG